VTAPEEGRFQDEHHATAQRAAAHALRFTRPGWDTSAIVAAIDAAEGCGYTFNTIVATLHDIASDDHAKGPGILLVRLRNGWRRGEAEEPLPTHRKLERCEQCQVKHPPDTPHGNARGSEVASRGITECRQALTDVKASGILCGCGVPKYGCKQHRREVST
jgi:hypothetical protein